MHWMPLSPSSRSKRHPEEQASLRRARRGNCSICIPDPCQAMTKVPGSPSHGTPCGRDSCAPSPGLASVSSISTIGTLRSRSTAGVSNATISLKPSIEDSCARLLPQDTAPKHSVPFAAAAICCRSYSARRRPPRPIACVVGSWQAEAHDRMTLNLSAATLGALARLADVPAYDRSALSAGIVHIGVGNFHRAHQAVYLDDLFNLQQDLDWALIGAGVRPEDEATRQELEAQDLLFTVVEQEATHATARIVGSMIHFLETGDTPAI